MSEKVIKLASDLKKQKKAMAFFEDFKAEIGKVSWTPKHELVFCTKLILASTFSFGLSIYFVDLIVKGVLDLLHALFMLIV